MHRIVPSTLYKRTLVFKNFFRSKLKQRTNCQYIIKYNESIVVSTALYHTTNLSYCTQPKLDIKSSKIDKRVWPIAASTFLMGTAIGVIIPIMPIFVISLGLSPTSVGILISAMGITRLIVNLPLASLCDILGRRPLLVIGPLSSSLSMVCTGLSTTLGALLFWRVITGFSSAAQMTGAQLYLSDISTPENRARTLAPMGAAWSAGAAMGPAIGGLIADNYGIAAPFYFVGVAVLMVAINNYTMLPETRPDELKIDRSQGITKVRSYISSAILQWKELLKDKSIQSITLLHTTFWYVQSGSLLTLLPLMAINFGITPGSLGGLYALAAIINVIGINPAAWVSDKFGRKVTIIPGTLIASMAVALLSMATSVDQLLYLVILWGMGSTILGTVPTAYLADKTQVKTRSQALALFRSGGDLGLFLGASISGFLASIVNIKFTVAVNACLLILSCIIFWKRAEEPKK